MPPLIPKLPAPARTRSLAGSISPTVRLCRVTEGVKIVVGHASDDRARQDGRSHDSQAEERSIPPVLDEEEPEDWSTAKPRYVFLAPSRPETRACGAVFQPTLRHRW